MIQRYDLALTPNEDYVELMPDKTGDWVRYKDVEDALAAVPVGEIKSIGRVSAGFILYKKRVYEKPVDLDYWVRVDRGDPLCLGDEGFLVQPVRLVHLRDLDSAP